MSLFLLWCALLAVFLRVVDLSDCSDLLDCATVFPCRASRIILLVSYTRSD